MVLKSFTYLSSVIHNTGGSEPEVLRQIGLAQGFPQHEYMGLLIPKQKDKDSDLQVIGGPCLAIWL